MHKVLLATLLVLGSLEVKSAQATTSQPTGQFTVEAVFAELDFFAVNGRGDLSGFFIPVDFADGLGQSEGLSLELGINFSLDDPSIDFSGGYALSDDLELLVLGELTSLEQGDNGFLAEFENVAGQLFEKVPIVTELSFQFDDIAGENPLTGLVDGMPVSGVLKAETTVVPLPLGFWLLVTGMLPLFVIGRFRRRTL